MSCPLPLPMPLCSRAALVAPLAVLLLGAAAPLTAQSPPTSAEEIRLFEPASSMERRGAESVDTAIPGIARTRAVRIAPAALEGMVHGQARGSFLVIELFDGSTVLAERERSWVNPSGSVSWVGRVRGGQGEQGESEAGSRVVLVSRDGVTVGSIRAGGETYLLVPGAGAAPGQGLLQQVDLSSPVFEEEPPTEVRFSAEERARARQRAALLATGEMAQDDGSVHDLLVVYTPRARDEVGGTAAIESLIDLGVAETNLSYEASGIAHRLRLAHAQLIDYDEFSPGENGPRDRLQIPDDGHMDEVHPLRDQVRADLVLLVIGNGGGCGRAFIMAEVSLAFEAYAFAFTNWLCISPGYTFQHELGHLQAGRHQWNGDSNDNAPFSFNHGYWDAEAGFRTIMAGNDPNCPGCDRRLAWSNPDRLDPQTGAPMGVPEGEPMACDNRKTLNATAWTVANFRVDDRSIFTDGFESGDLTGWSASSGAAGSSSTGLAAAAPR